MTAAVSPATRYPAPVSRLFCGLLRRAKRVCAFCVLPFRETTMLAVPRNRHLSLGQDAKDSSLRSE